MSDADPSFSLMVHGGAGALDELKDPARAERYRGSVREVLAQGRALLAAGRSALDVVELCAAMLEDDPLFNAGRGSVLNEDGRVEMDAAIMNGADLTAGAVAAVHDIANPIRLARRVMDTPHVMLVGEGASRLAEQCGIERVAGDYFLLPERIDQLREARSHGAVRLDHAADAGDGELGTIGAVARDLSGNLAAATSTGGMVNKRLGRVGDSPIIGAGVYADDASCAVSTTGYGEDFMRTVLARTVAAFVEFQNMDALAALDAGLTYFRRRVSGRGGMILIDRHGRCASGCTTPNMIRGWIEQGGASMIRF